MIKYTTYQFTKDRKIGIEIKAWERGYISGVIECRQDNGMMIRQHFAFSKATCNSLTEDQFLHHIITRIESFKPYAKQVISKLKHVH